MEFIALDAAGHRRSPATMPGYHQGRAPRNKGMHYPADPPTIEEIVAVMRVAGEKGNGLRLRALIVLLWRAGLRVGEALALTETDLDRSRGAVLVRRGKGGKRREVGMDRWAWQQLDPWLELRPSLPVGALLCVIRGATSGRHWEASAARKQLKHVAAAAGVRRRFAPHQLRHCPRDRDGARGDPAGRDPTPARARQSRDHLDLPPGDRQLRDHRHRPAPTISATAGLSRR
jgi:integrase